MKKLIVLLLILMVSTTCLLAQTKSKQIKGKVTDESGVGLPHASVLLSGSRSGVQADSLGNFIIKVPDDGKPHQLVMSFVGYSSQELPVTGTTINAQLVRDVKLGDEVVVIGYQSVKRRDLTSSVSSITGKQLQDVPVSTAAEALTGRLAGVSVTTTEGKPGADILIRVRGGGSITQDNSPLYIVDGIPVENALSLLSPQEIQSIDVLKDAASTAIYGSRGANGVILITTKSGKDMKTRVSYDGFMGVRSIVKKLDVMKPYDFVMYEYQVYNSTADDQKSFQDKYGRWADLDIYKNMPYKDWQGEVFGRDAQNQLHTINVSGGDKRSTFNLTLTNNAEDGIMLESGLKRTLVSFRFDHKASDRFKFGFTARYSGQEVDGVGTSNTGTQSTNRLRNAVRYKPFVTATDVATVDVFDPNYNTLTNLTNPVLLAHNELKYDYRNDVILNGYFSYDIIPNLTFKSVIGVTSTNSKTNTFNGTVTSIAQQYSKMPETVMSRGEAITVTNSNTLSYRTILGKSHAIDFLLGQETYQINTNSNSITTKYLPVDITADQAFAGIQKATPPSGLIQDAPSASKGGNKLISFFGRANYSYTGKYLATVTWRYDGSSKFAYDHAFESFPSVALAWRISQENFMKRVTWLSDLKLRASYGTAGNNRIGDDLYKSIFGVNTSSYAFDESVTPGFAAASLANVNLKWETTVSRNIGIDFSLFRSRINGSVDLYLNNTKDLLLNAKIPVASGYTDQLQNIGKTENKGIELQVSGIIVNNKNFNYTANFNISMNRNKIVDLGIDPSGLPRKSYYENAGWISSSSQDFLVEIGKPIGQFYGYTTDGFYKIDDFNYDLISKKYTLKPDVPNSDAAALGNKEPQPGDLKLKKLSNSTSMIIGADDRSVLGNAQPKFLGGFNQQFTYKNFDFSIFMNFSVGNKVYNANKLEFTTAYQYKDNNMLALMNDRWKWFDDNGVKVTDPDQLKAMNVNTKYWTPSAGQYFLHSFAIEDGSFLRISNITLGYSLPESLLRKMNIFSKFRVYATVNNLWTITGYSGFDPEANTRRSNPLTPAVDYAAYPRSRFILAGVNVSF
jgi:TonB-linked SusC/RagA family outer membrane protein